MWNKYERKDFIRISNLYTIFERKCVPGYDFKGESHEFWEMLYVVDGAVSATAGADVYKLKKNAVIFHKPQQVHKFRASEEKGARLFIMSFDAAGGLTDYMRELTVYLSPEQSEAMNRLLQYCRSHLTDYDSEKKLNDFEYCIGATEVFLQTTCSLFELMLLSLYENSAYKIDRLHSDDTQLFAEAIEIIESQADRFLSVPELAEMCGVSVTKLKTLFYKYTGLAPHSYCVKAKLLRAKQLFAEGCTIGEAAQQLGFCNQYYFTTVFKRELGITPSTYIKSMIR